MSRVPSLTSKQVIRALKQAGFIEDRQKGSHLVLYNYDTGARTVVPVHGGKTIKKSLLFAIIHDAGLTLQEFLKLL
ncbi:MAG TPA: type II toxin-antitoxin system HicA family toxin [Candidatus Paceibacterota bacterium]